MTGDPGLAGRFQEFAITQQDEKWAKMKLGSQQKVLPRMSEKCLLLTQKLRSFGQRFDADILGKGKAQPYDLIYAKFSSLAQF